MKRPLSVPSTNASFVKPGNNCKKICFTFCVWDMSLCVSGVLHGIGPVAFKEQLIDFMIQKWHQGRDPGGGGQALSKFQ